MKDYQSLLNGKFAYEISFTISPKVLISTTSRKFGDLPSKDKFLIKIYEQVFHYDKL
jgi:hypothetical protein